MIQKARDRSNSKAAVYRGRPTSPLPCLWLALQRGVGFQEVTYQGGRKGWDCWRPLSPLSPLKLRDEDEEMIMAATIPREDAPFT